MLAVIFISAYNERVKNYKNASFDIIFDQEASQSQVFHECGVPDLIRHVVDVSPSRPKLLGLQFHNFCVRPDGLRQDVFNGRL
jgi:hypothetical protein